MILASPGRLHGVALAVCVLVSASCSGGVAPSGTPGPAAAPVVTSIDPGRIAPAGGVAIVIHGTGFQAGATVDFGDGQQRSSNFVSATVLTAVAPAHAVGRVDVKITNPDGQSAMLPAALAYADPTPVIPPGATPTLTGVTPSRGPTTGGTQVLLAGTGFASGATVRFGATPATVQNVLADQITAVTPAGMPAAPADIVVTNPDQKTAVLAGAFTFEPPPPAAPTVSSIAPAKGPAAGGTAVTLTGTGFQAGAAVTLGGVAAAVGTITATTIALTTPAHAAGAVDVVVTNPGAGQPATLTGGFTYLGPAPTISSIAPAKGPAAGGTAVTLTGTGFQAGAAVTLGGVAAVSPVITPGSIAFTTPAHAAGAADVVVTNPDTQGATLAGGFTYLAPPPTLVSVAPASGPTAGGTAITVAGTGFQAGATVTLGGVAIAAPAITATSIAFTAPPHAAGAADVVVTNPDAQSATLFSGFFYVAPPPPPPSLASVTPTSGPDSGNTTVTITGTGFVTGATVSIGGTSLPGSAVTSPTSIVATTTAHPAGAADVVVVNPDQQKGTLTAGFTFLPAPTVASLSPATGPTAGGTPVTVTGSGFRAGATVTLGGAAVAGAVVSTPLTITFTTPPHAAGAVDLTVTNAGDARAATRAGAFTYLPGPAISGLSPASGPTAGGTAVTVSGSGFQPGATASLGGVAVTVAFVSASSLTFTAPAHAAGAGALVVTNPDGQVATSAAAFTWVAPPAIAGLAPTTGAAAGGTAITVSGSGFQAGATVSLGGVSILSPAITATSIAFAAPAHAAGTADLVVTNPDGQSATRATAFTYLSGPTISAVAPASGPTAGGTALVVTGSGFQTGATVTVGGTPATGVAVTANSIALTTPAHAVGPADLVVLNPDGQSATRAAAFTFVAPPTITGFSPATGLATGGTVVTLTGTGFSAPVVKVGANQAPPPTSTATSIVFAAPAGPAGPATVVVINADGQSATAALPFTYTTPPPPPPTAPTITSLAPASGPALGGTAVLVTGTNFQAGATATVGGLPATVGAVTATTLALTTPPHAAGAADVVITNPDAQTATLVGGFLYVAAPTALSVSPASGPAAGGTLAVLTGSGFQAGATVTVGGAAAVVGTVAATSVSFTTPAHAAGAADVVVTNLDGQKATLTAAFAFVAAPTLAAVAPASGPATGGTALTLTGTGFLTGATVTMGGATAAVGAVTATSIAVASPAHAAGGTDVVVTNPDGQKATLAGAFTFVAAPTIALVSPTSGPAAGGTVLTVTGTGFQAGATVSVGGSAATAVAVTATSLTATTPAHAAGAADVAVTNPDGQKATAAAAFTFVPAPAITAVAPATGLTTGGTAVTVTGSGFQAGATVTVGGGAATVGPVAPGSITLTTPAHAAGAADVVVTNPDGQKATLVAGFLYVLPTPVLTGVAPASGPAGGGTPVTLGGSGFQPGATVTFGGTAAAVGAVTTTTIAVTTPAHAAGAVDVVVTNPNLQTATKAAAFTYLGPAPTVASATPASGPDTGGNTVAIAGANFQAGATVTMGGTPATVLSVAPASISVLAPSHVAGAVAVTVVNPDGQSGTLAAAYTYLLPAPTFVSSAPASGPAAGGTTVTVTGTGFQAGATATVGGAAATVTAVTATSVVLVTPPGAAGAATVAIRNPDGQVASRAAAFTYVPAPTVASVAPATGSTGGLTAVTVAGTGFQAGATVSFGGAAATVGTVTATTIAATTPAHAAGAVAVTVVNPDGQSGTLAAGFTFAVPPTPTPTLASITPNQGTTAGGTTVVLVGTNFVAGATVTVGGVAAPVTGLTASAISCTTGLHAAGAADVVVTNPDGQKATLLGGYSYVVPAPPPGTAPPPVLTSLSPPSGLASGGTALFLSGTDFQLGATVLVGGVSAPVIAVTVPFAITASAPAHAAGPVDVTVVNPDGQLSTLVGGYTYTPLPALPPLPPQCQPGAPAGGCVPNPLTAASVTSVAPATGGTVGGDTVVINGTNFDPAAVVMFDPGNFATVVTSTPTALTVATPPHAIGLVSVIVVNPDGWQAVLPQAFTYSVVLPKPPKIKGITPASGFESGGNTVSIAGTDFALGATIKFGATTAAPFGVRSTRLDLFMPPHAPGVVDVTVTNPDGQAATLVGGYTFLALPPVLPAPTASALAPITGPVAGGLPVTVAGTNFVAGTKVLFDGLPAVSQGFSATGITVVAPAHPAPGFVDVSVVNPDGQVATLVGAFLYVGAGPIINTVALPACPMAGGTKVLIAGLNIQPGATVTFGGVPGIAPSWDPLNQVLTVITPPGPTPGVPGSEAFVNVVVVNPDGLASPPFARFRYGPPPVVTSFTPTSIVGGKVQCQTITITGSDFSVPSTGLGRTTQVRVGPSVAAFPDAAGNPPAAFGCNKATPILAQPTSTTMNLFLDAITPGSYRIIVTNFDGQFVAAPGIFFIPGP